MGTADKYEALCDNSINNNLDRLRKLKTKRLVVQLSAGIYCTHKPELRACTMLVMAKESGCCFSQIIMIL